MCLIFVPFLHVVLVFHWSKQWVWFEINISTFAPGCPEFFWLPFGGLQGPETEVGAPPGGLDRGEQEKLWCISISLISLIILKLTSALASAATPFWARAEKLQRTKTKIILRHCAHILFFRTGEAKWSLILFISSQAASVPLPCTRRPHNSILSF